MSKSAPRSSRRSKMASLLTGRVRGWTPRVVFTASLLFPVALMVAGEGRAAAQSDLSSISGTVMDASKAVIANAALTLTNEGTGAVQKTTTNRSGFYTVTGLAPGRYTITVEAPGFQKVTSNGNILDPSLPTTANLSLQAGAQAEITVQATQVELVADSATLGRVITGEQMETLPLNGRNPIYVALTKAGVTSGPAAAFGANSAATGSNVSSFNFSTGLGSIQINGGRDRDNLITYDGAISVRIRASGDSVGVIDNENVQEVQVLTTDYPAEYGRSIGGQIRIVTKSGGARLHGTLYEYLQNNDLNANGWTRNHTNGVNNNNPAYPAILKTNYVAPLHFNQFGGNVSGPVIIPHLIPKGKVFFLYSEAFTIYHTTPTSAVTVPNPAFRTGDFSSLLQGATPRYLKDPKAVAAGLACSTSTGGPGCFPGNIIPQARLSPNGVGLLSIYPNPTPNFMIGTQNLLQVATYPQRQQIDSGNLDIIPNDRNSIRFRLTHFFFHEDNPFSASFNTVPRLFDRPAQTASLDWVKTINAHTINEVLFTASHNVDRLSIDTTNGRYDRTTYGINYPYLYPGTKDLPNKIPTVQFLTNSQITAMDGSSYPSHSQGSIFDYSDTFTHVIGDHVLKAGALYERAAENDDDQIAFSASNAGQTNNQNGQFTFSSLNPQGSAYDLADAALGIYNTYAEVGARNETPNRANLYEFFAQDSFKVTPKLHLEYGVRYSLICPFYSKYNNAGTFDPAFYNAANAPQVNPANGFPVAGTGTLYNGTVLWGNGFTNNAAQHVVAAQTGQYNSLFHGLSRGYIHVQKNLIQPRLGIAYALNPRTVIRTGAGRYTNRQGVTDFAFPGGFGPLQQVASLSQGSVDNPGAGGNGTFPQLAGDIDQQSPQPEAYIWNVSVERELGFQTLAEVSYVGRHAIHQQYAANINQLPTGTLTNPANKGINANALRPYLGYGPINLVKQGDTAFYQGLQVDITHRFGHGLGFGVAYTTASSRDCVSFQKQLIPDTYNPQSICGPSDYDIRQVLSINATYVIPFKSGNRVLSEALTGWQVTQAYQFQTGAPFSVATSQDVAGVGPGSGNQLLNVEQGVSTKGNGQFSNASGDANHWFNVKDGSGNPIFTTPTPGTFATTDNRNILRAPGQAYFNASVQKHFQVYESNQIIFRVDGFDFPNHPNWNSPDSTYVSPSFGQVLQKNTQRSLQGSLRYSF